MSVVAKKIETSRKAQAPLPRLNDVLGEMTKRVEKGVRGYLGAVVEGMILDVESKQFSNVLDAISMPAMIAILEIDGVDRSALLNLDLDLVYHVVDLRLGGSPGELPEFGARRPTAIDNALCQPMVDIILESLAGGLAETFGATERLSIRCTGFEHTPMLANITGDKSDVLAVKISLDIGEAARSGDFELVLPFATLDRIKGKLKKSSTVTSSAASETWAEHMLNAVLETEVELTPVLSSLYLSVAEISRFEVGAVLPLEPTAHSAVELVIETPSEPLVLATARLGAFKGRKALKLAADPDTEFLGPLRAVAGTVDARRT